jgi:putative sigma-54 modulation protein
VQIKISSRHGHLGEDSRKFIEEKAAKLLRFFERLTSIEVMVDLNTDRNKVEFVVAAEHKHDFVASETHGDLRAAVDLVVDKLENQLRKYKEKVQDHHRTPARGQPRRPIPEQEPSE